MQQDVVLDCITLTDVFNILSPHLLMEKHILITLIHPELPVYCSMYICEGHHVEFLLFKGAQLYALLIYVNRLDKTLDNVIKHHNSIQPKNLPYELNQHC